jgi:hypothetical protein
MLFRRTSFSFHHPDSSLLGDKATKVAEGIGVGKAVAVSAGFITGLGVGVGRRLSELAGASVALFVISTLATALEVLVTEAVNDRSVPLTARLGVGELEAATSDCPNSTTV